MRRTHGFGFAASVSGGLALALALVTRLAVAETTLVFDGPVPEGGLDHFFVPFSVPPGTREIEVQHDDRSEDNILDFGLDDPQGYRGWGGGTGEPAIVAEQAASRAYVPGPIVEGTWRVVIGKAKVVSSPAVYHLEVFLRERPTLAAQPERRPYRPVPSLSQGHRYYAGDFHVHSRESTDARPTLDQIVRFARSRHLDFVEISDHNTVTQLDFFAAAQAQSPDLLLVPGIEYTTYGGHGNAIGASRPVEHKLGQSVAGHAVTIADAVAAVHDQGALFGINHPVLDLGLSCIGCAWRQPLSSQAIDAVEIGTGGLRQGAFLFTAAALRFWDALLADGHHVAAIGGSDDHLGGSGTGRMDSPIGDPTTLVLADELSVAALLDGIRHGRTVVKLQGSDDPMIELGVSGQDHAAPGDTLSVRGVVLQARISGGASPAASPGANLRWIRNGELFREQPVTDDPFVATLPVRPDPASTTRPEAWRVELEIEGLIHTVTSPIYVRYDEAGEDATTSPPAGCQIATAPSPPSPRRRAVLWGLLGVFGLAGLRARAGRRSSSATRPQS